MDANEAHDSDNIDNFLTETNMIDCFDDLPNPRPPTHNRGSDQIDLLCMSSSLFGYLDKAFINDPNYGEGDHSYFGMDFHLTALIQRDIHTLDETHYQHRILSSTDVKATAKFHKRLKKLQDGQNVGQRMDRLWERCQRTNRCSDTDRALFHTLADLCYKHANLAEETCKPSNGVAWSNMLATAGQTVQMTNKELRQVKDGTSPLARDDNRDAAISRALHNQRVALTELMALLEQSTFLAEPMNNG